MRIRPSAIFLVGLTLVVCVRAGASESVCYGTSSKGHLKGAVRIPEAGVNFGPYSTFGVTLGRTYVHSRVAATIADAYAALAKSTPDKRYVYGESGWSGGGRIKPHRTHQNGLAVDFFVPVLDEAGRSVDLPTGATNKFGYGIEFDGHARYEGLVIDFEAIADHLYALHNAARENGIGIQRVIFEKAYIPRLYATQRGDFVKASIPFMQGQPWVRHDEHYHVDFAVPCKKDDA
jgi:penicillin-insensitive murein endopeptidase